MNEHEIRQQQLRALGMPIHADIPRVHPFHKYVYVPGANALNAANRLFGFDGWEDGEVVNLTISPPEATTTREGKPAFTVRVSLVMYVKARLGGGEWRQRLGVGTDSKTAPDPGDALDNALGSALTYARKSALITWGQQFGLAVMRAKAVDANGRKIPWKNLCTNQPIPYPVFIEGQAEQPANIAPEDEPAQQPAPQQQAQQPAPQQPAQQPAPQQQAQQPAPQQPARQPAAGGAVDRGALANEIREQVQRVGNGVATPLLQRLVQEHGEPNVRPWTLGNSLDAGGPSDGLLVALRDALVAA